MITSLSWGSSPRMRGAPLRSRDVSYIPGIIPADAGSTTAREFQHGLTGDHPRGCGEHTLMIRLAAECGGSSPRMRGAHLAPAKRPKRERIIPADAGSTHCLPGRLSLGWDHPRGCGEHFTQRQSIKQATGSSPRMRGARQAYADHRQHRRIIPADAGSTRQGADRPLQSGDHPRGCGEHGRHRDIAERHIGSSPRMRGALTY